MRYLSVCSGIEAATVAWHPLGWRPVAFSEIEKFPSAVLEHHYPRAPNLGDFTTIDTGSIGRVDLLVGGTPCQAFSMAGARRSLGDERGNLTLAFVRLAHELATGNGLGTVVWENVPGVLSTRDNAFGCLLGGLVGHDSPIDSGDKRGRWPNAGMVAGPKGRAAWRILDAQYFGVAQRRRRVFLVADLGSGADPAAVLFERAGVRRNPPTRGEAGEGVAGGTSYGISPDCFDRTGEGAGGAAGERSGLGMDREIAYALRAKRAGGVAFAPEIARCDATREGSSQDYETTTMVAQCITGDVTHTLKAEGFDASEDGTGRGQPIISFSCKDYGADAANDVAPTLRAGGHDGSHANAGIMPAVAINMQGGKGNANCSKGISPCLGADTQAHGDAVGSFVRRLTPRECERLQGFPDDYTLIPYRNGMAADGPRYKALGNSMAVPCMAWLGRRIAANLAIRNPANDNSSEAHRAAG